MKSTLKCAVVLVAFSLVPETALAGKKNWKYVPPEGDALTKNVSGTYNRPVSKKYAVKSSRGDCGASAAQEATDMNNVGQLAGFIPVPYAGQVAGVLLGFGANDASQRAESQRWGCLRNQVAKIESSLDAKYGKALADMDEKNGEAFSQMDDRIANLEQQLTALKAQASSVNTQDTERALRLMNPPASVTTPSAPEITPDAPVAQTPEQARKPTVAPVVPIKPWGPRDKWVEDVPQAPTARVLNAKSGS